MGTVADRLRADQRRRFVGRTGELELFRAALASAEPPFTVLFVHGPGGIGKSSLLAAFADQAAEAGRDALLVDGRSLTPTADALKEALAPSLRGDCPVVLIDTFETLRPLEQWLRTELLPGLPDHALVVIAGREPPSDGWRADAAWGSLLRVVSLRNLPPSDVRRYLELSGVRPELHDDVVASTYGHPLAMVLSVEQALRTGAVTVEDSPDVVRALVGRLVADLPSPAHRIALGLSAHIRFTTESVLRTALDEADAGPVFEWLADLPFMESSRHGLAPHDVARDALAADLRWRDPELFEQIHRQARAHLIALVRESQGAEQERRTTDLLFLHRSNPAVRGFWDWASLGSVYSDRLRPGDREPLVAMTLRYQGPEQARLLEHWLARQPGGFFVFRADGTEPIGYGGMVALHEVGADDLALDPGARAMWEYAQSFGPTRDGEEVYGARFFMDAQSYQQPSPSMNMISVRHVQELFGRVRPAWDLIGAFEDAEFWEPLFSHLDFHHAAEASYTVGDHTYAVFAHDWRQRNLEEWLDVMGGREIADAVAPAESPAPVLVLSQPDFADAVRVALRDVNRPERLTGNPLLQSRLVRDADYPAAALAAMVREAVEAIRDDPRDDKLYRAVDRTYLRPASTQERAAEVLDLPFSTYRRHLARGVERVVAELWRRELYGTE